MSATADSVGALWIFSGMKELYRLFLKKYQMCSPVDNGGGLCRCAGKCEDWYGPLLKRHQVGALLDSVEALWVCWWR